MPAMFYHFPDEISTSKGVDKVRPQEAKKSHMPSIPRTLIPAVAPTGQNISSNPTQEKISIPRYGDLFHNCPDAVVPVPFCCFTVEMRDAKSIDR